MSAPITPAPGTAERQWLADSLAQSVANLGYPVGLGVQPDSESCLKAADKLLAHFHERDAALQAHADALAAELVWLEAFAAVRSGDDSKTFARVNRGALRTIRDRAGQALAAYQATKP